MGRHSVFVGARHRAPATSQPAHRAVRRRTERPSAPVLRRLVAAGAGIASIAAFGMLLGGQPGGAAPWYPAVQNVSDSMHRTVAQGLGTADVGGSYTTSPPANFAVFDNAGHLHSLAPGHDATATLAGVLNADQRLQLVFSVPQVPPYGRGEYVSAVLRRQANGDNYSARAYVTATGALIADLTEVKGGVERHISPDIDTGQRVAAGQQIVLEGQVTGSSSVTVQGRAWKAGSAAPNWQLTSTESGSSRIPTAGHVGIECYTSRTSPTGGITLASLSGWALKSSPVVPPSSTSAASSSPRPSTSQPAPAPSVRATSTARSTTTAPSTPAPAPTVTGTPPAPTGGRGSQPVGSASYPVPAGAIFVAPSGSDSSGTGASSAPLATIRAAVSRVSSGGTIVLRAGNYNEDLFITKSNFTIQNYPAEAAWLDGSVPVSSWTQSGNTWVHSGWTAQFDWSQSFSSGSNAGGFINPAYPLAAAPDQVLLDGQQLRQVSSNPGPGQFAVSYGSRTITVGSNPNGHAVRASNLGQAFILSAANITLRGFGVRNYATSLPQNGTIYLGGHSGGYTLQNLVIEDNATQGLAMDAPNTMIDHVTAADNGMTGITATRASGSTVQNSVMSGNNTEHFNAAPASAGIKIDQLDGFTIRNNDVLNNLNVGGGIWTDMNVTHFTIVGNRVSGNGPQYGIITELSDTGVVANNTISGAKYGYTAFDTGDVAVYNNSLSDNIVWDVGLSQDNRYQPGMGTAGPNVQPSAACPWRVRNITVANNVFGGAGGETFQFYALDKETNVPVDAMNVTINGNLFGAGPRMVAWGGGDSRTVTNYMTPQALDSAKGKTWTNVRLAGPVTASAVAANQSIALPVPSNVAGALGVSAGMRHLGTF